MKVPKNYKCHDCKATNIKLWRQTIKPKLLCAKCAATDQGIDISQLDSNGVRVDANTDQIGWYVPAIPDEEEVSYWGYTSMPQEGIDWWKRLPN